MGTCVCRRKRPFCAREKRNGETGELIERTETGRGTGDGLGTRDNTSSARSGPPAICFFEIGAARSLATSHCRVGGQLCLSEKAWRETTRIKSDGELRALMRFWRTAAVSDRYMWEDRCFLLGTRQASKRFSEEDRKWFSQRETEPAPAGRDFAGSAALRRRPVRGVFC